MYCTIKTMKYKIKFRTLLHNVWIRNYLFRKRGCFYSGNITGPPYFKVRNYTNFPHWPQKDNLITSVFHLLVEKSASSFRLSSSASLASMDSGGMQSVPSSADLQSTDPTSPNYKVSAPVIYKFNKPSLPNLFRKWACFVPDHTLNLATTK